MTGLNAWLQAVVAAAIPVLSVVLISLIRAKISPVAARTENERVATRLAQGIHAVDTAVPAINQTHVDALKQHGSFSGAEQAAALEKATQTAGAVLSASTVDFIKKNCGISTPVSPPGSRLRCGRRSRVRRPPLRSGRRRRRVRPP